MAQDDLSVEVASFTQFIDSSSFLLPNYLYGSAWCGHAPFAFWLVGAHRPRTIVELGTHYAYSYFCFCQAVEVLAVPAKCYAVDTWAGDEHAGFYDDSVFREVKRRNEAHYGSFSRLIRSTFDEALSHFEDGTIDLLHIDGRHFYEDVKEDFLNWLPKLSERSVVLFHDISVRERGFGVHAFWEEVKQNYPSFEFLHGNGLGILGVGNHQERPIRNLFEARQIPDIARKVRESYARLGSAIEDRRYAANARSLEKRLERLSLTIDSRCARIRDLEEKLWKPMPNNLAKEETEKNGLTTRTVIPVTGKTPEEVKVLVKSTTSGLVGKNTEVAPSVGIFGVLLRVKQFLRIRTRIYAFLDLPHPSVKKKRSRKTAASDPQSIPAPKPKVAKKVERPFNHVEGFVRAAIEVGNLDGWRSSAPFWSNLWNARRQNLLLRIETGRVLTPVSKADYVFDEVEPNTHPASESGCRWCVYTTLFGKFDDLAPVLYRPEGVDFIVFSDTDISVEGWRLIRVPSEESAVRAGKKYKLFPHRFLNNYDASLFVDASTLVLGDVRRFVERWCIRERFAMWRHAHRCDVYDEAEAILVLGKSEPTEVLKQISSYEEAGLVRASGLVEAGFIWRVHEDQEVQWLMDEWMKEIKAYSPRDQLSFGYLMWRTGIRPHVFPSRLGNIRLNSVTCVVPHISNLEPKITAVDTSTPLRTPRSTQGTAQVGRRKLCFLYADAYEHSGSTLMRGRQLSQIISERLGSDYEVSFTNNLDIRDSIVVLTKGCLVGISQYNMQKVWRNNIGVIADFVDAPLREGLFEFIDVLWASSLMGYRDALLRNLQMPVDMVTHHVDPRLNMVANDSAFSVGYFGEIVNSVRTAEIDQLVHFVPVNTRVADDNWLAETAVHPMHYAVRPALQGTGCKPFLKGFTAAACGANILVDWTDGDARFYLGDEYPYIIERPDPSLILEALRRAKDSFGGPEWNMGLEIMRSVRERCSHGAIASEVARSLRRFNE